MDDWKKDFDDLIDKTSKLFEEGSKDFIGTMDKERKKVEIRAQIGHHERAVSKAYARLGEAYYTSQESGAPMADMKDVTDLIRSNLKVIELLKNQLSELEKTETK